MNQKIYDIIYQDDRFHELVKKRRHFVWLLTFIIFFAYFSFILTIAFFPSFLAQKIGNGIMNWGMPFGIGIIFLSFILTGVYIKRANEEFDVLTKQIKDKAIDAL